jgi:DNA-directed RNA polymerase specialized sigma24 family protein
VGEPPDKPPTLADVLRQQPALVDRLFGYVLKIVRDHAKAEDIAQDVLAIALAGEKYPWNGTTPPMDHLGSIANSRIHGDRTKAANRREKLRRAADDPDPEKPDSRPSPMSFAAAEEHAELRVELAADVMARLEKKGDHVAIGSLRLTQAGTKSAEKQADLLQCTVKDIYRARERVAYHRETVVTEARAKGRWP